MDKIKFKISGMHCTSCAMNIDFDLEDLEGVKSAKTNYANEICDVEYDPSRVNLENLKESIKKSGYQAEAIS